MKRIGFIVNPIAGMGGRVALKGTDNKVEEAIELGAEPVSPKRAEEFLCTLREEKFELYTCSGIMGEDVAKSCEVDYQVIYRSNIPSTADDTKKAAKKMKNLDLIAFVGGDGTARDVLDAVDKEIPMLGIPSGVKMYSGVFANTPRDAAFVIKDFLKGETTIEEREVLDIDEDALRREELRVSLKGYGLVPSNELIQMSKDFGPRDYETKREIAEYVVDEMEKDTNYFVGGGSTTYEIKKLCSGGSLLGVDLIKDFEVKFKDMTEEKILENIGKKNKIIVSPIGGQGFIFGRGNEQISPEVLRKVGLKNIEVVSTPQKIRSLKELKVDTGDSELDESFPKFVEVITGYREKKIMKVR